MLVLIAISLVTIAAARDYHSALPHASQSQIARSIHNYLKPRLELRDRNERLARYENSILRKSDLPIYIIRKLPLLKKHIKKTRDSMESIKDLFDENGMIYITKPKNYDDNLLIKSLFNSVRRSGAKVKKEGLRQLLSMMNEELNKRLLEMNNKQ